MDISRRDFLKSSATAGLAAVVVTEGLLGAAALGGDKSDAAEEMPALPPPQQGERRGDMIYRTLGRTAQTVSLLGIGGSHLGVPKDAQEAVRIVRTAVDRGVTFMDNAWDYNNGESEVRMGLALRDGYRDKVFLMTKVDGRTRETAAQQLDESLKRLQTDHLDLLQLHEVIRLDDPDRAFAPGGAIEALREAQKAGKTRFIGFTGHKDPLVHLRMLQIAAEHGFRFDTVQMPVNVMDAHFRSFRRTVLPVLVREEIGVLTMKPLGGHFILESKAVSAVECLHFAMSQPVSVVITGCDSLPILQFKPMTPEEQAALLARTAALAAHGKYELNKTTEHFDSTAKHPEWLGTSRL
jgi:aryl-alcohol dehydrogenase-like predicted oxidoreductase